MPLRRALLLVPPGGLFLRDDRCQSPVERHTIPVNRPPMNLAYAAAVLEQAGVACTIRDYPIEGRGWSALRDDLSRLTPDLCVINVTAASLASQLRAAREAKRLLPDCLTVAKGGYAAVDDEAMLRLCPELDVVWRGEIDTGFAELVDGRPFHEIDGITFRTPHSEIVRNPDRPYEEDLDRLPFPARHLLDNRRYFRLDTGWPVTVIQTSRGCPARCAFCTAQQMAGRTLRQRRPERVADEIEACVRDFGIRDFLMNADTFTWKREWVLAFCGEILRRPTLAGRIRWAANARVDRLDDERLRWMRRAGCTVVSLGIESGCQEVLDRYHKDATPAETRAAIEACHRHGLLAFAFVILGGPWETEETLRRTVEFVVEADPDFAEFAILKVHPGTDLFADLSSAGQLGRRHGLAHYDWVGGLPLDRVLVLRRRALWRFHLRPRYVARALRRGFAEGRLLAYLWFGARHLIQLARPSSWESPDREGVDTG
jgi:anaerobic magnesium-protoporphyrin IX monomethyl ester cyclase